MACGAEEDLHKVDAKGLKQLKEVVSTTLDNKLPDFLEIITDGTLPIFATQLNSVQMITKATHDNPDFHQIFKDVKNSVKVSEGLRAVEQRCRQLLEALDKCGGPVKDAANTLAQEWSRKVWDKLGIFFIQRQPYQPSTDISVFNALHLPQPTQLPPHPCAHAVYIPLPTASVTPPYRVLPNFSNKIRHQLTHEPQFAEQVLQPLDHQLPSFQNALLNTIATAPPKQAGTLPLPGIQSEVNVASLSPDSYSTEAVPASVSGDEHNSQHVPSSYMSPYQQGVFWTDLSYRQRNSFSSPHESVYLPGNSVPNTGDEVPIARSSRRHSSIKSNTSQKSLNALTPNPNSVCAVPETASDGPTVNTEMAHPHHSIIDSMYEIQQLKERILYIEQKDKEREIVLLEAKQSHDYFQLLLHENEQIKKKMEELRSNKDSIIQQLTDQVASLTKEKEIAANQYSAKEQHFLSTIQ